MSCYGAAGSLLGQEKNGVAITSTETPPRWAAPLPIYEKPLRRRPVYSPNLVLSQLKTCLCSSIPARRTWLRSQIALGFSPVKFFAP